MDGADLSQYVETARHSSGNLCLRGSLGVENMSRSRNLGDCTKSVPTRVGSRGIWCCRRLVAHHGTSVFAVFSFRRLLRIHDATSSMHVHMFSLRAAVVDGSMNVSIVGVEA